MTTHSSSKRTIISALTRVEFVSILVIISIGEYVHSGPVIHDVEPVAHRVGVQGILHKVFIFQILLKYILKTVLPLVFRYN